MSIEHLSPAQRELYDKAKAALNVTLRNCEPWWKFNCAAQPAAVIDILTQLGEALEMNARMRAAIEGVNNDDELPNRVYRTLARALAARPATAEGTV